LPIPQCKLDCARKSSNRQVTPVCEIKRYIPKKEDFYFLFRFADPNDETKGEFQQSIAPTNSCFFCSFLIVYYSLGARWREGEGERPRGII
jgi:hypothetical protein